jgi:hypothetical protein
MSNKKDLNAFKRKGNTKSSSTPKSGDRILGDRFNIPIPRSIKYILIPVWILTLLYPLITEINNESSVRLVYSFFPFLGIGVIVFFMIRLLCPKEIITTKEGAFVAYRGKRVNMIPWNLMVFVPRKRTLAYGFEDLIGIGIQGHRTAYVEASLEVANALKKKKELYVLGVSSSK